MTRDVIIKKYRTYYSSIDRSEFKHYVVYLKSDGGIYTKPVGEKEYERTESCPYKITETYKKSKTFCGITYCNKYIAKCIRLTDNKEYEMCISKSDFKLYSK